MRIHIEWQKPILLASLRVLRNEDEILELVAATSGVYFFSRKHGQKFEPFYIGETGNMRKRLKDHLAKANIRDVLRKTENDNFMIKQGARYFHPGVFRRRQGQDEMTCLKIVQKVLIRKAIEVGYPLLNSQLTKIRTHHIEFSGEAKKIAFVPKEFEIPI